MVEKRTWEEFRNSGLLWFINTILHAFGWAICVNVNDDGSISAAFPARVKFRGFSEEANAQGYISLTTYLKNNIADLAEEAL